MSSIQLPAANDGFLPYYLLYVSTLSYPHLHQNHITREFLFPRKLLLLLMCTLQCGIAALTHSAVCYICPSRSLRQFSGSAAPPRDSLLAHVYGIKNVYSGCIRLYAAYHIENAELYSLATWTFAGVLVLFLGEFFIWRTARLKESIFPFVTAGSGLVWMLAQRNQYLR